MLPQLTESWASAYLQVLIGLFVFALGIPAIMFQLVVEEGIRHLADRYIRTSWWRLSFIALVLSCIAFIWFLQPKAGEEISEYKRWIAGGILTVVLLLVGLTGFHLLSSYRRENIIAKVKEALMKEYEMVGAFEEKTLNDLIYLGEHSEAGYEKALVLQAYREIAETVQNSSLYKGEELNDLILSLIDILKAAQLPGNEENYFAATGLLAFIRKNYSEKPRDAYQDVDSIRVTLTELGIAAIRSKSERTALKLLKFGASYNSDIALTMGISAFRAGRYLIATNALNIPKTSVEREGESVKPGDATSRLLGLLSHFATGGGAARRRAQAFFENGSPGSFARLNECLGEAFEYHRSRTDFETADKIKSMSKLIDDGSLSIPGTVACGPRQTSIQ